LTSERVLIAILIFDRGSSGELSATKRQRRARSFISRVPRRDRSLVPLSHRSVRHVRPPAAAPRRAPHRGGSSREPHDPTVPPRSERPSPPSIAAVCDSHAVSLRSAIGFARCSLLTTRLLDAQAATASRAYTAAIETRGIARVTVSEMVTSRTSTRAPVAFGFAAATFATFAPAATLCAEAGVAEASAAAPGTSPGGAARPTVVFVLGGPGAGKGTQCANIVRDFGFTHLSAGDLLRAHMKSGSADGNMVAEMIKQGQIVPSEVTVNLLLSAMKECGQEKFLIDGFPRNKENRDAWEATAGYDCDFVLFFDCPEEVMLERLLGRNEGRTDDNVETIKKRFVTFQESSMPVVQYYETLGKVRSVIATELPREVYAKTETHFAAFK